MTTSRTADVYVEAVSHPTTDSRVADLYVEAVAQPTTRVRVADLYVEMIVVVAPSGWAQGITPW